MIHSFLWYATLSILKMAEYNNSFQFKNLKVDPAFFKVYVMSTYEIIILHKNGRSIGFDF